VRAVWRSGRRCDLGLNRVQIAAYE
jgi:hypothetical protein